MSDVREISEIFATDPLSLTRTDITATIEYFRKARGQFNLGNMKAGNTKPAAVKKTSAMEKLGAEMGKMELDL